MDEYKIECSECGEDLTPLIQKRTKPVIENLVKMRLASPEITDIQITSSKIEISCPRCKSRGVYPVDMKRLAEAELERS